MDHFTLIIKVILQKCHLHNGQKYRCLRNLQLFFNWWINSEQIGTNFMSWIDRNMLDECQRKYNRLNEVEICDPLKRDVSV